MSSIDKHPHKGYRVRWRDGRGKQVSRTFPTREKAKTFDKKLNEKNDASLARRTLAEWGEEWVAQVKVAPRTAKEYRSKLRLYVIPTLGHKKIEDVDRSLCKQFVEELQRVGLSAGTIRYAVTVLSQTIDYAIEHGAITQNPALRLRSPTPSKKPVRILEVAEVETLARAAEKVGGKQDGLMIRLTALTGLRAGELMALKVGDVDLVKGQLTVAHSLGEVYGEEDSSTLRLGPTKTGKTRIIPWPKRLSQALRVQIDGRVGESPLFQSSTGGFVRHTNWSQRTFATAKERAGFVGLRFHDLRHTYAALLIRAGAPPLVVMQAMGHSTIRVTMDVYGHLFPGDLEKWVRKI